MKMKGIDVSSYQGDIDFSQVKNSGIEFVIIKAGEWNHTVDKFEEYYEQAKAAGLHIGFYWFCDGETLEEISQEADACIKALEGKQFDFPIYMDIENQYQYNLGKEFCSNAARTFCDKLEKAGYYTGLYTATSWLNSVIDQDVKDKYTIWVADWRGYCGYEGNYSMWQYGAGYVPGINGKTDLNIIDIGYETDYPGVMIEDGVDLDYAYEDFPSIIVDNGFNNYPKKETKEEAWEKDDCKKVANTLDIRGYTPILSGDRWFLIDKSCIFTLETLPYAKVNLYLVGGGEDGAEWFRQDQNGEEAFFIGKKSRGGCVLKKEIYITGNVECKAFVAEPNNAAGTSITIGNDVYKCTDTGYIHRKATSSSNAYIDRGGNFNAESGANGIATPYGYVGSSGGGGGAYSIQNYQYVEVSAGKGGAGAGDGGDIKKDGTDATNYGCGGGAAGFGGFPSDGDTVVTHAGHGTGGCIIFEILDGGGCDESPNKPVDKNNSNDCSSNKNSSVKNCSCGSSKKSRCTSYDVQKWGENWLLFNETGEYSLTIDKDTSLTAYIVGGGSDGEDGFFYNSTAYGGSGGKGGVVNIVRDIVVNNGELSVSVIIGGSNDNVGTSVTINNNSYDCYSGVTANNGGYQGISGKHGFKNAGNGSNGVETPFGVVGSSGGGGAAYCAGTLSGYGKGGLNAGNGGKIVNEKSTAGDSATSYGCGGGGGAASSSSWCKGGRGKKGCVIIHWN